MFSRLRCARGFTRVELFVVLVIAGLLLALLLPAFQHRRPYSRRASCTNHQRELASAILQREARKQRFSGFANTATLPSGTPRTMTWVNSILRELGCSDVADDWSTNDVAKVVPLEVMLCPGDPQPITKRGWSSYVVNCGQLDQSANPMKARDSRWHGIFQDHRSIVPLNLRVEVSLADVAGNDGAAQTMMLSEDLRATVWYWNDVDQPNPGDAVDRFNPGHPAQREDLLGFVWDPGDSAKDSSMPNWYQPINKFALSTPSGGTLIHTRLREGSGPAANLAARLSSSHSKGVVVAFADMHISFISEKISPALYRQLCTVRDASAIDLETGALLPDNAQLGGIDEKELHPR